MKCQCGKWFKTKKGLKIHRGNTHRKKLYDIIYGRSFGKSISKIFHHSFLWDLDEEFGLDNPIYNVDIEASYDQD